MIRTPAPTYQIATVYTACVDRTEDPVLNEALAAERARVLTRSASYLEAGAAPSFHTIQPQQPQNLVHEELSGIYERVMVQGGERAVYLGIKARAYLQCCPLCAHRDVTTLDHYLPKENYPEFAVLPINLVPSCMSCNGAKHTFIPATAGDQLFHPFFDDWSAFQLLRADVQVTQYIDVDFFIDPAGAPPNVVERAQNHFERLQLGSLYALNAAVELVSKRGELVEHFDGGGTAALASELTREATSRRRPFRNTWQPALYRALAASDEFSSGGFNNIDVAPEL